MKSWLMVYRIVLKDFFDFFTQPDDDAAVATYTTQSVLRRAP